MRALVLVLLLAACSGDPKFHLQKDLSCDADYVEWGGGLTASLAAGKADGTFDYDPPGAVESRINGMYDLASGDFGWTESFDEDHYRERSDISGYGYAATNGDLDIEYSVETEDILGDSWTAEVREIREGCDATRMILYEGDSLVTITGHYQGDQFTYERLIEITDSEPYTITGETRSDLTYTEEIDLEDGSWSYSATTEGDGDGYSLSDWEQEDSDFDAEGYDESFIDGRTHYVSVYDYGSYAFDYDYTIDYEGNGGGTALTDGLECELTFEEFVCTYECDDGSEGDC